MPYFHHKYLAIWLFITNSFAALITESYFRLETFSVCVPLTSKTISLALFDDYLPIFKIWLLYEPLAVFFLNFNIY